MVSVVSSQECFSCHKRLCSFLPKDGGQSHNHIIRLNRGERLETCAGNCLKFWIVISGTAAICTALPDGRRQITGIETAGDTICGPMATPESPIWLEALDECQVCELDFSAGGDALRKDPDFLSELFGVVHTRLEAASRHVTTLGRLDSTERVILFLADMAIRANMRQPVRLPMSREDIADYLGLNAETVSRIFSRIKKSGLVTFLSPTEYMVPDLEALKRRLPVPVRKPVDNPMEGLPNEGNSSMEKRA